MTEEKTLHDGVPCKVWEIREELALIEYLIVRPDGWPRRIVEVPLDEVVTTKLSPS